MRYVMVILIVLSTSLTHAQSKKNINFRSYNAVGFLAGKTPVAFSAQTVNGVAFKKWFVGAGFGVDDYFFSSLPLFVNVKRFFVIKNTLLFLYADVGTHFITHDSHTRESFSEVLIKGKLYADGGAGVSVKAGKTSHLFFTVGNSLKNIVHAERGGDERYPFTWTTKYDLSRITLRLGFQF